MEPHAQIDHASGIAVLAVTILVLSNLASNVPTGMYADIIFRLHSIRTKIFSNFQQPLSMHVFFSCVG